MTVSAPESLLSRWTALQDLRAALAQGVPCVTASVAERHRAARDLGFFLSAWPSATRGGDPLPGGALEFPPAEAGSWRGARHREQAAEHALCCHRLLRGDAALIVTTPSALSAPLLTPAEFRARAGRLAVGESVARDDLLALLDRAGYERVETVLEVGQWSLRGGIVDIFSPAREAPVRAEFFGDEVESLRLFDPTTQRSVETMAELAVLPLLAKDAATCTVTTYLPAATLVALEDPGLLEAPPDD